MKPITEEDKVHEKWYEQARKMTPEELPAFIDNLINKYEHDYGTICHAIAAAGLAAMHAVNRSDQGGITGFQAGAVMWQVIGKWGTHTTPGAPARILDYQNMLFPQSAVDFTTITAETWEYLQNTAKEKLEQHTEEDGIHPDVIEHWQSIVSGNIPFGLRLEDVGDEEPEAASPDVEEDKIDEESDNEE